MSDAREAARRAIAEGLCPVPIPSRAKGPVIDEWQKLRITEPEVDHYFQATSNIGVILGEPSKNLHDVDLDCDEAIKLADDFLPPSNRVHGRAGKPRSHRFFLGDEPGELIGFKDPITKKMLVELRGTGGQTVIPPSIHPSGEKLEWVSVGTPANARVVDLRHAVARLAAACLLVRYYPMETRHEFTLALAGFLLRRGLAENDVTKLMLQVAQAVGPDASRGEDLAHIRRNVHDTAERIRKGEPATGGKTLKEYLDTRVMPKLAEWLGLTAPFVVMPRTDPGGSSDTDLIGISKSPDGVNEKVDDPHRVGRLLLASSYHHPEHATVVFHDDEFYRWSGVRYEVLPESSLRGEIAQTAKDFFNQMNAYAVKEWEANGGVDPETGNKVKKPTCKTVSVAFAGNVRQALCGAVGIPLDVAPPAWLDPMPDDPPAAEIVSFKNELVYMPVFVSAGNDYALARTPRFFSLNSMDFDFDPAAPEPTAWWAFLRELWPDEEGSIRELQKWFGYVLTSDTSQQKILALIGPPRSGKGTIVRILRALVGEANVAGPTLSSFATNFGLWPLMGKTLAVISDARITGRTDAAPVIERLLSISGEDSLTVDRKNLPPVTSKLGARLMLLSNELPRLGDSSTALSSRMVILGLSRSWLGHEDPNLTQKLLAELPGILLHFALPGWRMLREDGHFDQPESGRELVEEMESLSSPVLAFVQERCVAEPGAAVEVQTLFDDWLKWCGQMHREKPGDCQSFGRNLRAALPHVQVGRPRREGGERVRMYSGIRLRRPGEEWSAMVRGHFYSTRERESESSSSISIELAIGRTADHRGPEEQGEHACVTCAAGVTLDEMYCATCWSEQHPRRTTSG